MTTTALHRRAVDSPTGLARQSSLQKSASYPPYDQHIPLRDRSKPPTIQPHGTTVFRSNSNPGPRRLHKPPIRLGERLPRPAHPPREHPDASDGAVLWPNFTPYSQDCKAESTAFPLPPPPKSPTASRKSSEPVEVAVNFRRLWSYFVDKSLNSQDELDKLLQEKEERSSGRSSPEFPNYHSIKLPGSLERHTHRVIFNADAQHLDDWKTMAGLEDCEAPRDDYMTELFYQVAKALEDEYGWTRDSPSGNSTFRYSMSRPQDAHPRHPVPAYPQANKLTSLLLPSSPSTFLSSQGDFWCRSIAHQFQGVRAHRHTTIGLVFHSWMNNSEDVCSNVDALPPPIWFLLYAMQAAFPGVFVIREEAENAQVHQTIERGLPPYDILAHREAGPFFRNLLGTDRWERTCEAAEDARLSTKSQVFIKGSVRPRRRSACSGSLAPLPPGMKEDRAPLFRQPSWLRRRVRKVSFA